MSQLARITRSPLAPIFLIVFSDVVGMGMTMPVLPLFAQDALGASPTQIALLPAAYFMAQFFAAPRLGRWSDRVGRRKVLIFSQIGTLLAMLLTAWAPSLWVVFLARLFDGFTAGNISVAFAYASDVAKPQQRARSMGVVNAGFGAGFMFGPALGGLLGGYFGPRLPFLLAACMSLVSIAISSFRLPKGPGLSSPSKPPPPDTHRAPTKESSLRDIPGMKWMLALGFGMQLAMLTFTSTWVLWVDRVLLPDHAQAEVQRTVGYIFTWIGSCGLLTQAFLVGPAVLRWGERKLILGGLCLRGAGLALIGCVPVLWCTVVSVPLVSVGGGLAAPSLMALVSNAVPAHRRGQALGSVSAAENLGRILGPALSGLLFEQLSPSAPILAASALCLTAALLSLGLRTRARKPPDRTETEPWSSTPPAY